jgi:uncharacterized protein (DUF305 family)
MEIQMYKTMTALALAASLFSLPAIAQQQPGAGHGAHHPDAAQSAAPGAQPPGSTDAAPGMPGMGEGQGMMGQGMMGMMNCPMMSRGMGPGMGRGMGPGMGPGMGQGMGHGMGHGMGMQAGSMQMGPLGDQGVASLALNAVNEKMHREMSMALTGRPDEDFVRAMIVHHQGAIDMARVVLAFGEDQKIRELADAIIEAQEGEIAMMQEWLVENAPQ